MTATAESELYTLSLHDALPIYPPGGRPDPGAARLRRPVQRIGADDIGRRQTVADRMGQPERRRVGVEGVGGHARSEEHTSELQSRLHLVCRLLLEKKKTLISST